MARETLNREKVLDAALLLAREQGIAKLSMRKLAGQLGVEAMSLYNHVTNKADLLDGMAARVFESIVVPDSALAWDERLRLLAERLYAAFTRHPAVLRALAAEQANPRSAGALKVIDAMLTALLDAGLDERGAARGYRSTLGLVFGAALTETVGITGPDNTGLDNTGLDSSGADAEREVPTGVWFATMATEAQLPSLQRVLPALARTDCVQDFAFALDLVIAGLRTAATETRPPNATLDRRNATVDPQPSAAVTGTQSSTTAVDPQPPESSR